MKTYRYLSFLLLITLFGSLGCFDQQNPNDPENTIPEIPELILFRGPVAQAAPEALQNSIDEFNSHMATGYTYLSIATISSPNSSDNHYVWEVSAGGFTATIEATKTDDGSVDWVVTINGSDGNLSYDNWVAMRGTSNIEGTNGEWHIFAENSTDEVGVFTWQVLDNGVKIGTFTINEPSIIYEVINNADGSGSFIKKEGGVKVYEAVWDAAGNGSWTLWDLQGNVVDSGNWS